MQIIPTPIRIRNQIQNKNNIHTHNIRYNILNISVIFRIFDSAKLYYRHPRTLKFVLNAREDAKVHSL